MHCILEYVNDNDINIKRCIKCGRIINNNVQKDRCFFVCKQDEVKPKINMPSIGEQMFNFLGAIKDFIQDPSFVSLEDYEARLKICESCPLRSGNRCSKCGCNLSIKEKGRAFHCPEKKWPGD